MVWLLVLIAFFIFAIILSSPQATAALGDLTSGVAVIGCFIMTGLLVCAVALGAILIVVSIVF